MGTLERKIRERINRENTILDAAEKVFFSQGFDQSTMDDVAKTAELSKGSLYNYFKNKNELCIGIVSRSLRLLIEYMEKSLMKDSSGLNNISRALKAFLLFKEDNPEYYCALQSYKQHSCGCGSSSKFLNSSVKENRHINTLLIKLFKEGISDNSISKDVIPEKAADALWGEFSGILPGFDLNNINSANTYKYALELIINGFKK